MRKWTLCLILAGLALPALAANRVTVEQLEQALATTTARSDADVARQLSALELTERLSAARLEQLKAGLPGEKSQQALLALADTSAFRDPPAADMPATATPDRATQRRILSLTVDYLGKTLPMLPTSSPHATPCALNPGRRDLKRPRLTPIHCMRSPRPGCCSIAMARSSSKLERTWTRRPKPPTRD